MVSTATAHRQLYAIPETRHGSYINSEEHAAARRLRPREVSATVEPQEIALEHIKKATPGAEVRLRPDYYIDEDTGVWHGYFTQTLNGLDIENTQANVNVLRDGTILSSGSSLLKGKLDAPSVVRRDMLIDPVEALKGAIEKLGYPIDAENAQAVQQNSFTGGRKSYVFVGVEGVKNEPKADLAYYTTEEGLKAVWRLETDLDDNYMITYVNANDANDVVGAIDYVSDATYRVYPFGTNDPTGERVLVTNPANSVASPNGWHKAGSKSYTDTRGNNGFAQENWDGGSDYIDNVRGSGGSSLKFDFPYDPSTTDAKSYISAATTQLFYTVNMYHDLLEVLGFTEAAGNFEEVNTGSGGIGGDAVQLNAQDGSGYNNANFLTLPDGQRPRMRMYLWNAAGGPLRDGDFDESIVVHEYTHGLSNRLTGGPSTTSCLSTTEAGGMGEGWGDFYGTAVRINPNDTRNTNYALAEWANGKGIRKYPYSTSLTTNPTLYSTVGTTGFTEVHSIGSIWANMLYEVMWNLEDKYGYDKDPFPKFRAGTKIPINGRQLAMKLVLEGMKLQPCRPTFLTARTAIIDADVALTGGENKCELWRAFAKRGLGVNAKTSRSTKVDDFSVPSGCASTRKAFRA
ncbi:extracellular metallo proteinase 1 [Sphaerosporella brunnea]|uniref:Extracellular metalloproteinase n=1 Tax=Sphaerosporella brunnea TaxID=1250544 RepID=A0A5J5F4Y8_9PEZI|nr:extracellular metallo proteinase 1 [Sphaerosporella brunnea]